MSEPFKKLSCLAPPSPFELTPFSEIAKQPPVMTQTDNAEEGSNVGKIAFLGGIVLDALLDIDPWVFYVILGESGEASSRSLVLCAHRTCLETWPCLASVGAAVLITNATVLWVPFESNSIFRYISCHTFHAARTILSSSSAERREDVHNTCPCDHFPTMTPMVVVTLKNIEHVYNSNAQNSVSSTEIGSERVELFLEQREPLLAPRVNDEQTLSGGQRMIPENTNTKVHQDNVFLERAVVCAEKGSQASPSLIRKETMLRKEDYSTKSQDQSDDAAPWGEYLDF
uniref:Uncharacterized protein n=1 Tax=Paramoeba aestuarina TaxID=180227 RepID=A0A7S4N524_9EUKA|mmetsp:Transcript_10917/g.16498  ORF Transcript_10917/g.16498 Transcript_10917/m.16498 type:complete len:285 (+) Transcript_10917:54-908(+)